LADVVFLAVDFFFEEDAAVVFLAAEGLAAARFVELVRLDPVAAAFAAGFRPVRSDVVRFAFGADVAVSAADAERVVRVRDAPDAGLELSTAA
jgi:hypothetical protein